MTPRSRGERVTSWIAQLLVAAILLQTLFFKFAGALPSPLAVLGIEVQGDDGLLFALACAVLAGSLLVVWLRRSELPGAGSRLGGGPLGRP